MPAWSAVATAASGSAITAIATVTAFVTACTPTISAIPTTASGATITASDVNQYRTNTLHAHLDVDTNATSAHMSRMSSAAVESGCAPLATIVRVTPMACIVPRRAFLTSKSRANYRHIVSHLRFNYINKYTVECRIEYQSRFGFHFQPSGNLKKEV